MKIAGVLICAVIFLICLVSVEANDKVDRKLFSSVNANTDAWGRVVIDNAGKKINYSKSSLGMNLLERSKRRGLVALEQAMYGTVELSGLRIDGCDSCCWGGDAYAEIADSFDPLLMRTDYAIGSYAQMLGTAGIHAVDVNNDSVPELFVGHSMMWYMLQYEPESDRYEQRYFYETATGSTFGGGGIVELRIGDADGDGSYEVVILMDTGWVNVYDALTGKFEVTQNLNVTGPTGMALGNVEPGPEDEIIVINDANLYVFQLGTLPQIWALMAVGGYDVAAGNVDADSSMEIAIAAGTGTNGYVVDVVTRSVQWNYAAGFGNMIAIGEIDGDNYEEVVACQTWGNCMGFDCDTQILKWSFDNFNSSAIRTADIDFDGIEEVVIGDKQWGDVDFYDGITGSLIDSITNPEHSVSYVEVADVDGDCSTEVIWGAGYTSTGSDRLYVADIETEVIEWENYENDGPMHSFAIADIDADGQTEVIRGCDQSDAGYDGSLVFVTDLHHYRDENIPSSATNDGWMVTQGMAVAQLDADPQLEYIMNNSTTYDGKVSAFDGNTHISQWTTPVYNGEFINAVQAGDIDGGGTIEVLVGTGKEHTGAAGVFARIFNGSNGSIIWQSPSYTSGWEAVLDLRIADVDGDATVEFLVAVSSIGLYIYDGVTRVQEWSLPSLYISAIEVGDVDGDSDMDILIGYDSGILAGYDGSTKTSLFQVNIGTTPIYAIRVSDIDNDNQPEIILTQESATDYSRLKIFRGSDRTLLWQSDSLPGAAGLSSSLYVADVDDDGLNEVAVSTSHTLRFYEYSSSVADNTAPVFDGTVGAQSATQVPTAQCCAAVDVNWDLATDGMSPPVRYNVYRDTQTGFIPDANNFIAQTGFSSYRDKGALQGVQYYYIVRATDREGNEDANLVEATVLTNACGLVSEKAAINDSGSSTPNGIIEEDEQVELTGTLTNQGTLNATSVSGLLTTPSPIVINNPDALYPDIAPGAFQSCTTCYSVTAPSTNRIDTHWDFTVIEEPHCTGCTPAYFPFKYHVGNSFNDVPPSNIFYAFIETLLHLNVVNGCQTDMYCPLDEVLRQQMAKFICNSMNAASAGSCTLSGCTGIFQDVFPGNIFCSHIEALYNLGIISGCSATPLMYCPTDTVKRSAMTKFICNAMEAVTPGSCPTVPCAGIFADVDAGNIFCSFIEAVYNAGVVNGCQTVPLQYCPEDNVTREQMSKFIINAFSLSM